MHAARASLRQHSVQCCRILRQTAVAPRALHRRPQLLCKGLPTSTAQIQRRDSGTVAAALFGISGSALLLRATVHYGRIWWNKPRAAKRYKGGFKEEMDRREAALILGVRCVTVPFC